MSDSFPSNLQNRTSKPAVPIELWSKQDFRRASARLPKAARTWVDTVGFTASSGDVCIVPARDGRVARVLFGVAKIGETFQYAKLAEKLPKGRYEIVTPLDAGQASAAALGWALAAYSFTRYQKKPPRQRPILIWPEGADADRVGALARAIRLGRDLINTPAEDMGPEELAKESRLLAERFGAKFREVVGDRLLESGYPAIHAVGRASSRAPRLIDFVWGKPSHPKVTLVGKGVCFDTGGLDLKPADNMKLMKKDMGGAATVLTVASAVMELNLPIRLRVLIPAVENSVSGNAIRPLDVISTRKGLTVEIGNTDAEGRLILSDALADADAERPDLIVDVATLTGAARVALGTDLPALFSTSDALAHELLRCGRRVEDPLWRMPLHRPYRRQLDSRVADLNNISNGPYGGAIVAALFLREFVSKDAAWMHIDTMAFNLESRPGRPYGGEVFAARALFELLQHRYTVPALRKAGPSR